MLSCEFKGVADVIVISGEVLGTMVVTAVEALTFPDDGETSGLNAAGSVTAGTVGAGPITAGSAFAGTGAADSAAAGTVIGKLTADKTMGLHREMGVQQDSKLWDVEKILKKRIKMEVGLYPDCRCNGLRCHIESAFHRLHRL